jgi:antitoxin component of RelBE/YafQ-DinJ toxin-antitoxin module
MQTTLRIDDRLYREAKAEAARMGITLTRFLEDALRQRIAGARGGVPVHLQAEIEERDRLMEKLLRRTARFRVGVPPTREEMNAR